MAMAAPIPPKWAAIGIDDTVLILTCTQLEDSAGASKAMAITGKYKQSKPGCFEKEGSGKIYFDGGYWYISDPLGEQIASVSGELARVPKTGWQTKGEGFFGSRENLPITVHIKKEHANLVAHFSVGHRVRAKGLAIAAHLNGRVGTITEFDPELSRYVVDFGGGEHPVVKAKNLEKAPFSMYQSIKERLPNAHRQSLGQFEVRTKERKESLKATALTHVGSAKDLHAKHWPTIKEKALEHGGNAKDKFNEYHPIVRQKTSEGYTKCFDFWTHPDTHAQMHSTKNSCLDGVKFCLAGCVTGTIHLAESAFGKSGPEAGGLSASDSDRAMDASYVKLDSTTPVFVEAVLPGMPPVPIPPGMKTPSGSSTSPERALLFSGDIDDSAIPDDAVPDKVH